MPNPAMTSPAEIAREIDAWCERQSKKLSSELAADLRAGVPLHDPEYRQKLGQQHAFMRIRSFIHGSFRSELQKGMSDG